MRKIKPKWAKIKRKMAKKMNKKTLVPVMALSALAVLGTIGVSSVLARQGGDHLSLAKRVAQHFNLDQNEVEKVFEEERQEHQAQMRKNQEERLDQLVSEGKITAEQKQLILAKQEEMRNEQEKEMGQKRGDRGEFQNLTVEERKAKREERRTEMDTKRKEMEKWLEENGIDKDLIPGLLRLGGSHGGPGGPHGPEGKANKAE